MGGGKGRGGSSLEELLSLADLPGAIISVPIRLEKLLAHINRGFTLRVGSFVPGKRKHGRTAANIAARLRSSFSLASINNGGGTDSPRLAFRISIPNVIYAAILVPPLFASSKKPANFPNAGMKNVRGMVCALMKS